MVETEKIGKETKPDLGEVQAAKIRK